ncbi:hypothetical protein [Streptomyces sp. NBC_00365]|uniref:hypothetical protein n=1 Tax=Streptomyces sp. NBC_00365 TaxID=2975726 RepID=UPI00224D391D|nr:hypothetical protein [Streptomyces sp. NBC_00365]
MLCTILAATAGSRALPELLRAFARDLGDDQGSLSAILTDFAHQDRAYARSIVLPWAAGPDPDLRRAALWLLGFVPEPSDRLTRLVPSDHVVVRRGPPRTARDVGPQRGWQPEYRLRFGSGESTASEGLRRQGRGTWKPRKSPALCVVGDTQGDKPHARDSPHPVRGT